MEVDVDEQIITSDYSKSNKKILEVKNITKVYKDRIVLSDISFDVFAGEIFGFLGPNGAGKTTLIRIICGMTPPTSGEIFICGKSVQHNFEKAVINLGAMIENCQVYNYMSGYQNLVYYANLYGKIDHEKIDEIVEMVDMTNRIHDKVRTYSYGMRQRIALAQALLHNPKLLVLDEPTNGLDANGVIELRETLKIFSAKNKIAILVSSHILSEMEQLCNTFAVVNNGHVLEIRSMEEANKKDTDKYISIKVNYPNYASKIIFANLNIMPEIVGSSILIPYNKSTLEEVTKLLHSKNIVIYENKIENKSLEELYLDILKTKK